VEIFVAFFKRLINLSVELRHQIYKFTVWYWGQAQHYPRKIHSFARRNKTPSHPYNMHDSQIKDIAPMLNRENIGSQNVTEVYRFVTAHCPNLNTVLFLCFMTL